MFTDKTLLITGGTGSFGNAVLKKFLKTGIKEIRILSRDEKKQNDMRSYYRNDKLKFYIGDVRDYSSINYAMKGVDYVFHAAALKQVPSCEFYPMEAVKTNVIGTENVINSAVENKVKKIILLSTDKAVYPINSMGMTKGLMEKLMLSKSRSLSEEETIICATRYGNVMGSRGSVIPLFIDQIKNKMDITITDPNMTRFMMSLEEAVELVIYCFIHGKQGDIFVQKSPASTIENLAIALNEIFKGESKINIIGTRHGEKLFETLITREEMTKIDDLGRYYRIPLDDRDLNYNKYFYEGKEDISFLKDYNSHNTKRLNLEELKSLLLNLDLIKNQLNIGSKDEVYV
ncbi:putative nucleoside-diphosphate sugar epimerase [Gottschalkia purinilytica]|uniref:UDP-glucose 4-epimerase n=1 Tax=Gottschalkia purinilytica TaxID=1503 RepID=A0A0L0WDU9_GOTPU|nr:polysaccharide biosynthesis protein [Gottschalkia purinilytica]KNF09649.1 putative nucleoside-diphosphate sugar epimerase [Gottschalkia purinilytica]